MQGHAQASCIPATFLELMSSGGGIRSNLETPMSFLFGSVVALCFGALRAYESSGRVSLAETAWMLSNIGTSACELSYDRRSSWGWA